MRLLTLCTPHPHPHPVTSAQMLPLDLVPSCVPVFGEGTWFLSLFTVPGLFLPGVDLISACDIRYCAQDAFFQVKVRHFLSSSLPEPLWY